MAYLVKLLSLTEAELFKNNSASDNFGCMSIAFCSIQSFDSNSDSSLSSFHYINLNAFTVFKWP